MKKISYLLIALLLLTLVGCGTQKQPAKEGNLLNYDLGEGTLRESSGREIPYEIQGVLGIPAEKNCPVVVLIHGSHPIEKASESRYDTGFNYLSQALSEQGNLVISMNVAINYSFENGEPYSNERTRQIVSQQLTLLKKAVDGDKKIFGYDLSGLGDFTQIVLMGHSRGGLDVMECGENLPEGMQTVGIAAVAPATYKTWETPLPNVPTGIIIPQMDGDVKSLDGSDVYEQLIADEQYTSTAELIYLKKANHGYFNTQLTQPDMNHNEADVAKLMQPQQQRSFLVQYLSDFVKSVTTTGKPVFASAATLESTAYGCDVLLRVHSGTGKTLWSAETGNTLMCTGSAAATRENGGYLPANRTIDTFKMPELSFLDYALQHIIWNSGDAAVSVPITGDAADFRFLDVDMAIDSTDPKNNEGQSMTLVVADTDGNTAQYDVEPSAAALLWQEGELIEGTGWDGQPEKEYSTFTPLVTLRIELSQFSGIDLSRLASMELSWRASQGGSIMLRSVDLS